MSNPFARLLETSTQLSEQDVQRGSRLLVVDGVCAMDMGALAGFDQAMLPLRTISSVEGLRNRIALPMASLLKIQRNRQQENVGGKAEKLKQ